MAKVITEWWFKDETGKKEKRMNVIKGLRDKNGDPLPEVIEVYQGRLYKKEVTKRTRHNKWIAIQN